MLKVHDQSSIDLVGPERSGDVRAKRARNWAVITCRPEGLPRDASEPGIYTGPGRTAVGATGTRMSLLELGQRPWDNLSIPDLTVKNPLNLANRSQTFYI